MTAANPPQPSMAAWTCAVSRLGPFKRKTWRKWNPAYNAGRRERYAAMKGTVRRYVRREGAFTKA